jgi:acyl-ACP dehydrogenase
VIVVRAAQQAGDVAHREHLTVDSDAAYEKLVSELFDTNLNGLIEAAEQRQSFPRALIEALGQQDVLSNKWIRPDKQDLGRMITLADHLGRAGSIGIGVGVSLHDTAIAILRRFGKSAYLDSVAAQAINGDAVLCIAASEAVGGSDLQHCQSHALPQDGGYRLRGRKKFVSLASLSDYALLLVRGGTDSTQRPGDLALFAVPTEQLTVASVCRTAGAATLETASITFDTWVSAEALVARPGTGLAAISWGFGHLRLSLAAQFVSASERVLGLTAARMKRRAQFEQALFEHQALRLRIADLYSRVAVVRMALRAVQTEMHQLDLRTAAALKVTAARLAEEVFSECMHVFGGAGYLADETPLSRWWRDIKLGRIGGGTDEVLWEVVAAGIQPNDTLYERLVNE